MQKTEVKILVNEEMKSHVNKQRKYVWLSVIVFELLGNSLINSFPSANTEAIPTIANGIVTATSILVAVAVFSFNLFYTNIQDLKIKQRYSSLIRLYLSLIFVVLILSVLLGYYFIFANKPIIAFSMFMSLFIIECGIIMDIWWESELWFV